MEQLGAIAKTIRLPTTLGFTSAVLAGMVLAGPTMGLRMVGLLIFSISSAAFGFTVNDLFDADHDRSAGVTRNPVSTGQLSRRGSATVTLFFLLVSLAALSSLSIQNMLLGLVVLFLYLTYSGLVRAKARPVLDIAYHGLCLAVLATMGYTAYVPFNFVCFLFASIVFLLSSMSQILQEVRDYETDRRMIVNTVTLLGKRSSLILCLALFVATFPLFFLLLLKGAVSPGILILSPLTYFILSPLIRGILNEEYEGRMLREISQRRLVLIALLVTALIFGNNLRPLMYARQLLTYFFGRPR